MASDIKVAFITGIFSVAVGIIGTLGVNSVVNNGNVVSVYVNGEKISISSEEYSKMYSTLQTDYDVLKKENYELIEEIEKLKINKAQNSPVDSTSPANTSTPNTSKQNLGAVTNIGKSLSNAATLSDNYGNSYTTAYNIFNGTFHVLLNMNYSRFKSTVYVQHGETADTITKLRIEADGEVLYSTEVSKTTRPINLDLDISGYNEFMIITEDRHGWDGFSPTFGDCAFYK